MISHRREIYISDWLTEREVKEYKEFMQPKIEEYHKLKERGYQVSIDIDDEYDIDYFDEEVFRVYIELSASIKD